MAKFDTDKRNKIVKVLERVWLHTLKTPSSRTMIADLITKELFGDDEGILNNTAYGDNPITPAVNIKPEVVEEEVQVSGPVTESEEKIVEPVVEEKKPVVPKEKPTVQKKKSKGTDLGNLRKSRRSVKPKRRKKDGISRFSK